MDKEKNESQDIKNAMAFVPLLAFIFLFIDQNRTKRFNKNISYAISLFIAYVVSSLFLFFISYLILILYFWISVFLWYMAYLNKDVDIKFLDNILNKIKENKK